MSANPNRAADQLAQLAKQGSAHYGPHNPEHQKNGFTPSTEPEKKGWLWKIFNLDRLHTQTRSEGEDLLQRIVSGIANEREVEVYLNGVRTQVAKLEIEAQRTVKDKRILKRAEDEVRASDADKVIRAADAIEQIDDYLGETRSRVERNTSYAPYKEKTLREIDLIHTLATTRIRINAVGLKYDATRGNQREYFE